MTGGVAIIYGPTPPCRATHRKLWTTEPARYNGSMSLAWLRIKLAVHLTLFMLVGAAIGYVAAPILVVFVYTYDHGHQTEEFALVTIPGAALAAAALHFWLTRNAFKPNPK